MSKLLNFLNSLDSDAAALAGIVSLSARSLSTFRH